MLQPNGAMFGGMAILWLVWLAVSVFALIAFFRGMRALVQIAERLEGIERVLAQRP
jgi:hypothetical protein